MYHSKNAFFIIITSFIVIALDLLVKAIEKGGYTGRIKIGIDAAASEFFNEKENKYDLNNKEEANRIGYAIVRSSFLSY